jgi:aspartate aminotransferase
MGSDFRRSPTLSLASKVEKARASGIEAYSLSTPSFVDLGPRLTFDEGLSTRLKPAEGDPELREILRDQLFGRWNLPEHRVVITTGAKAALYTVLRQFTEPGDAIVVVSPRWPTYDDIVQLLSCELHTLDTRLADDFQPSPETFRSLLNQYGRRLRALVIANPNNPAGNICSGPVLQELFQLAERHGVLLILDESFSEVVFDHDAWTDAIVPYGSPRLVVINSLSKGFHLQGLRVGACLVHKDILDAVVGIHQTLNGGVSSLSQAAALNYLRSPRSGLSVDLRAQRDEMLAFIRRQRWDCVPCQGTFYHFPNVGSVSDFESALKDSNLFYLPGEVFGTGYENHVRLCFAREPSELTAILARLETCLQTAGIEP